MIVPFSQKAWCDLLFSVRFLRCWLEEFVVTGQSSDLRFPESVVNRPLSVSHPAEDDFDQFLSQKSKELEAIILDNIDVFKWLRDR